MESINTFFSDLGAKMPFASDFFARNLLVAGGEVNVLFLVLLALVVAVVALVVIFVMAAKAKKAKRTAARIAEAKANVKKQESKPVESETAEVAAEDQPAEDQPAEETAAVQEAVVTEEQAQEAEEAPAEAAVAEETTKPEDQAQEDVEAVDVDVATAATDLAEEIDVAEAAPAETEIAAQEQATEEAPAQEVTVTVEVAEQAQETAADANATTATTDFAEEIDIEETAAVQEQAKVDESTTQTQDKNSDAPKVAMEVAQMKKEEVKQESVKEVEDKKAKKALVGTFEVSLCLDGYRFCLYASNKQLMYESVGFTSSEGAMKGIETFRKTLQEYPYIITRDKYGRYRYVFNKRYQGENYTSAASAQSAAESVKRWAENAKVIVRNPKPEELDAYKKGLEGLRTKDDVDWDLVAKEEKEARPMGKFTVEEDGNQDEVIGYRFYLIANNAQILYTSAIYATAAGALKAIDTFKRAVYVGNFYVDEDKFGHFRYILRSNATTTYVGESYKTRASAESSIESVKKFVKCAVIVPYKKGADQE